MLLSSLQPLDIDRLPFDKYILTPAVIDRCKFQSYFRVLRESMIEIYISHRARRHSLDFKYTPPCYSRELFYLARVGSSEGAKQKLHRIAWRWGNEGHQGSPPPDARALTEHDDTPKKMPIPLFTSAPSLFSPPYLRSLSRARRSSAYPTRNPTLIVHTDPCPLASPT